MAGPGDEMELVSGGVDAEVATAEAGSWLGGDPPAETTMAPAPIKAKTATAAPKRRGRARGPERAVVGLMHHYRRAGHPRWAKKFRILCPLAPTAAPVVGAWKRDGSDELEEETVAYFDEARSTLQRRGA